MAQSPWQSIDQEYPLDINSAAKIARQCARHLSTKIGDLAAQTISQLNITAQALAHQPNNQKIYVRLRIQGVAHLHPAFLADPQRGIKLYLSRFLLKYIPELQGFWLAFDKSSLTLIEDVGFVYEADRYGIISVRLQLDVLLFRPIPSALLIGEIQQIRPSHVSLLVLGLFNCTLRKKTLQTRFKEGEENKLIDKETGHILLKGDKIQFKVIRCTFMDDTVSLEGSISDTTCTGLNFVTGVA